MGDGAWERVKADSAAAVCKRFAPGESALKLLSDDLAPQPYLGLLIEGAEFPDAIRFLAHALPNREAVWWACLCVRQVAGEAPPAPVFAALKAAEAWVADPTEENRRKAQPAAEEAGYGTAAGCAAASAFWSGGSLAPPNMPVVPPADHLCAHGASCAVMLAAVASEPEKAPEKSRGFLKLGMEIARGEHPWPEPSAAAPSPSAEAKSPTPPRPGAPKPARPTLNWD